MHLDRIDIAYGSPPSHAAGLGRCLIILHSHVFVTESFLSTPFASISHRTAFDQRNLVRRSGDLKISRSATFR